MRTYVLRRLLALVPTLLFASFIVFATVRLIPGSVIDLMLSRNDIAAGMDRAHRETLLGLMALIVALCVAVPIGVYSAMRQDTRGDHVARSFSILTLAIPGFWPGTLIMVFPSIWWGWSSELRHVPFRQEPLRNPSQWSDPAYDRCGCRPRTSTRPGGPGCSTTTASCARAPSAPGRSTPGSGPTRT